MDIPLLVMSFGVGVLIGLTSMGGAALMAPFLILVVGVAPATAVGTDLAYGAVTKIVGAWIHFKQGTVDMGVVRKLATGSLPGGLAGSLLVILLPNYVHDSGRYLQKTIGALLIIVATILILRALLWRKNAEVPARLTNWCERSIIPWGAFVGFCVGATSIGSGSLLAPFLLVLFRRGAAKVVGTDVFHAALLVSTTALFHGIYGGVNWGMVPILLAGSIPGVVLGSRIAARVPEKPLRAGLATVLLLTGVRMF